MTGTVEHDPSLRSGSGLETFTGQSCSRVPHTAAVLEKKYEVRHSLHHPNTLPAHSLDLNAMRSKRQATQVRHVHRNQLASIHRLLRTAGRSSAAVQEILSLISLVPT